MGCERRIEVKFNDDADDNGRTPARPLPARYVVPLPEGFDEEEGKAEEEDGDVTRAGGGGGGGGSDAVGVGGGSGGGGGGGAAGAGAGGGAAGGVEEDVEEPMGEITVACVCFFFGRGMISAPLVVCFMRSSSGFGVGRRGAAG